MVNKLPANKTPDLFFQHLMMDLFRLVLVIFSLILASHLPKSAESFKCTRQINSCSCVTNLGSQVFDLSPLDTGGSSAKLSATDPNSPNRLFEYNPCSSIPCPTDRTAAICNFEWLLPSASFPLGALLEEWDIWLINCFDRELFSSPCLCFFFT